MTVAACNGSRKAKKNDHAFTWDKARRLWKCWGCGRTTSRVV